jgi:hypothetical protein
MSERHDKALIRVLSNSYPDYRRRRPQHSDDVLFLVVEIEIDRRYVVEVSSIEAGLATLAEIAPGLNQDLLDTVRRARTMPNCFAALFVAADGSSAYVLEHTADTPAQDEKPAPPAKPAPLPPLGRWMRPATNYVH